MTKPDQSSSIVPSWAQWRGWLPFSQRTTQENGEVLPVAHAPESHNFRMKGYLPFYPLLPFFSMRNVDIFLLTVCPSIRPLWLSPRQVMLVPVNPSCEDYAKKVGVPPHWPHVGMITFFVWHWALFFYTLFCFHTTLQVCKQFTEAGFMADADLDSSCLLNKKIRNAQLAQYNFILGEKILLP